MQLVQEPIQPGIAVAAQEPMGCDRDSSDHRGGLGHNQSETGRKVIRDARGQRHQRPGCRCSGQGRQEGWQGQCHPPGQVQPVQMPVNDALHIPAG